jgi:putative acetyltransferase
MTEEFLASERKNIPELYLPNAETWVWEDEGRVVGFLALLGNEVGALFVAPEFHRQGIGRALMDHAREIRSTLEVEVFVEKSLGRSFYEPYGFEPFEYKMHEPTGHEVIRMRLAG